MDPKRQKNLDINVLSKRSQTPRHQRPDTLESCGLWILRRSFFREKMETRVAWGWGRRGLAVKETGTLQGVF